jgi:hypothetical protein
MCNLYSVTTNQEAIRALFRVVNRYVGNLPPMPGVFPDYPAPVVRNTDAGSEMVPMRWGMPPPPRTGGPPVDMLFSQISSTPESNRYKKADEVIKHIYDTEKVGTIDAPSEYFHGTLDMRWGPYGEGFYRYQRANASEETSPLAYFSGHRDRTLVALCGSTKHLIGLDLGELGKTHAHSYSITPMIETFFRRRLDLDAEHFLDDDEMRYFGNSGPTWHITL